MTTLATIRQAMTAFLAEAGIEALSAWPKEVWKGRKTPVAVVQVRPARPAFRTIWGRPMIRRPGNGPSGMGGGSR